MLKPAIRTLPQAVEAVLAGAPAPLRPLDGIQKQRLILELLHEARGRGELEQLAPRDAPAAAWLNRMAELVSRELSRLAAEAETAPGDLGQVLRRYRKLTDRHALLDTEGRLAMATRMLQAGDQGLLGATREVVVTGFRRFSALERGFLAALGRHAERVIVELPCGVELPWGTDADPREDSAGATAWSALQKTTAELMSRFEQTSVTPPIEAPPETDSESTRVGGWLFRDPREAPEAAVERSGRYTVVAAPSRQDEMRLVAGRVKRLLQSGYRTDEVLLATRRVADVAARAEHAFAAVGVPLHVDQPRRLRESPLARSLVTLLRLSARDWRRDDLLALVTNPAVTFFDRVEDDQPGEAALRTAGLPGPRAAVEWSVRELMLPGGRSAVLERVAAAGVDESASTDSQRSQRRARAATVAEGLLRFLSGQLESWGNAAAPLEWCDRWRETLAQLQYRPGEPRAAEADEAALAALEASAASLERLALWREEAPPQLSADEALDLLEGWLDTVTIEPPHAGEGRVALVSAETARQLRPRLLVMVGMTEASFPAPPPESPISPARVSTADHYSREMLLFYELTQAATERVTFSYAALDDAGQPLAPSSYVAEVERLLSPLDLREPLVDDEPLSASAVRRDAVRALNAGDAERLAGVFQSDASGAALASGLRGSLERAGGDSFGPHEGVLTGKDAAELLAGRFNQEHLWSPTQLETYAACPFKFFLRQVLGIEPVAEFDLSDDYRRRGSLLHEAMVHLHRRLREAGEVLTAIDSFDDDEFLDAFRDAVDSASASIARPRSEAAVVEIEARQATKWGAGYRQQLADYAGGQFALEGAMQPAFFEARFGPPKDDEPMDAPSRPEPFALDLGDEKILLTGQVDRIDLGQVAGQPVFNVVDYKTSRSVTARLQDLRDGRQLQLYLYALATEQHLLADQNARPWRLGYWAVRDQGFKAPGGNKKPLTAATVEQDQFVTADEWAEYGDAVRQRIRQIVDGVRRGEFPMFNTDENCGRTCEFRTTCRVAQARSLGKAPPGAEDEPAGATP